MNISEILELTRAGFSKEEIIALATPTQPAPTPAQVVEPTPAQIVDDGKEPKVEPTPAPAQAITLTDEQLKTLAQNFAVQTASGSIEIPKSSDEKLSEHFLSILKGE